jgi:hypothetical protein
MQSKMVKARPAQNSAQNFMIMTNWSVFLAAAHPQINKEK